MEEGKGVDKNMYIGLYTQGDSVEEKFHICELATYQLLDG